MPIYVRFVETVKGDVTAEGHDIARAGGASGGVWKTTNFLTNDPVRRTSREPGLPGVTVFLDHNSNGCSSVRLSRISLAGSAASLDARDPMPTRKAAQLFEEARSRRNGNLQIAQLYVGGDPELDAKGRLLVGTDGGVWRSGGGGFGSHNTGALRNVSNNNWSRGVGSVGALQNVSGDNTWAGAARPPSGPGVYKTVNGGQTWNSPARPGVGVLKSTDGGRTWRSGVAETAKRTNNLHQLGLGAFNVPVVEIIVSDPGSSFGTVFRLRNATVSPGPTGTATISYAGLE
jgi:hypothetical protein